MYSVHCSDTFNENTPPTNDTSYISSLGASVYKAMVKADKDAVWLMQVCSSSNEQHISYGSCFNQNFCIYLIN